MYIMYRWYRYVPVAREMTKYAGAVIIRVHVDLFGYCSMNEKTYFDM